MPRRTDYTGLACCFAETGSVKQNVEPFPTTDSTQIVPPCISIIRFEMASPRPVPPLLARDRIVGLLELLEQLAWSALEIPGPVSRTATLNDPLAQLPVIETME